jgi:uncharacterized protein (DUF1501 family)
MKRRSFLSMSGAAGAALWLPRGFGAQPPASGEWSGGYGKLLILVELKGGNDGLNTVIPFADPAYYTLRKNIGIKREHAIQLDEHTGLHPALQPLMPLWRSRQLAIVQGVGYAQPNVSHFRSMEIWDTASRADEYLRDGWLTRAFAQTALPAGFTADGVVIGSAEMGPLANGVRPVALTPSSRFIHIPELAPPALSRESVRLRGAGSIAAKTGVPLRLAAGSAQLKTQFPEGTFGNAIKTAMQMLATGDLPQRLLPNRRAIAVVRLTLNGFDTHQNQPRRQAALLEQLAQGFASMKSALVELGRWNDTLVMTYAEFGRRPRENGDNGTDHGSVAPHFLTGGRVRGGLYGSPPTLARLDGNGNLPVGVDFRRLYATVLGPWWGLDVKAVLQQPFEPLPLLRV